MTPSIRKFIQQFTIALAAISSGVTCIAFLFQDCANALLNTHARKSLVLVTIIILCWLYSCFMNCRKTRLTFKVNEHFQLSVEEGDIFKKKGVIVIPVNEYFDTHVGDGIVSPRTVHGKWINKHFSGRVKDLNDIIEEKLRGIEPEEIKNRKNANEKRYNLGTYIDIDIDGNTYVLIALSHFDDDNHANVDRVEFADVFDSLMKHLQHLQIEAPIYMPLMGTGLSRLGRSPQRILNFLVDAIDFKYSDMTFPLGFNIVIYDLNTVNLNDLDSYIKNGITL